MSKKTPVVYVWSASDQEKYQKYQEIIRWLLGPIILLGLLIFVLSIWAFMEFRNCAYKIAPATVCNPVLIIFFILAIIILLLCCYGMFINHKGNSGHLSIFIRITTVFCAISVILMIILWIYTIYEGSGRFSKATMELAYSCSNEVAECWDDIHEMHSCCGWNSPKDWITIPHSCCNSFMNYGTEICDKCKQKKGIPLEAAFQDGCKNHLDTRSMIYFIFVSVSWLIVVMLFMRWWLGVLVWLALIGGENGAVVSPEEQGLRADSWGPGPGLLESSDPATEPSPEDLNATDLMTKLGSAFDVHFMSVNEPPEGLQAIDTSQFSFRRRKNGRLVPMGPMPQYIREVELGVVKLADGSRLKTQVPVKLKRKLRQLLWALTACPVGFKWRDLGPRFWPRWIREGLCPRSSCSVPAGMKCRPLAAQHKTLLRWHCRSPACQWIKVQYPVVVQCSCACSSRSPH
ncbi:uncharacterized protein [Halyomorpha halys]|uniref:uncharacterized protein isoform X2 n=1 Tax=Halyomorpha halys TaxID=286706 RepID=UPI0006D52527|nr:uncharacterized protein LOC106682255 isoform X2 [Halyomorpha halys]